MAENETPKTVAPSKPVAKAAAKKVTPKAPAKAAVTKTPAKAAATKSVASKPAAKPVAAAAPEPVAPEPVAVAPVAPAPKATKSPVAAVKAPEPTVTRAEEKPAKAAASPTVAKPKAAPKTAPEQTKPAFAGLLTNFMLEETTMDMSANFTNFQDAVAEAQAKAKEAFEKGTSMMGEASDFTKGNVEAMMEASKILAEGMQSIGAELVSEGRSAFESMSGDIKELAAAKSPTDFFKLQSEMARKNFDSAVATSSKNSEAMLKLMSDAMAPLSGRVSMAMEKVRTATAA